MSIYPGENLCRYDHPLYRCGTDAKKARLLCKFFHPGGEDSCRHFNIHGCGDCASVGAQFECWCAMIKPEKKMEGEK